MKKSILKACAAVLCGVIASAAITACVSATAYQGQFTDVKNTDWFFEDVATAYTLNLINGKTANTFEPNGTLTIAETIKLASCCHQYLKDGCVDKTVTSAGANWYDVYVDYATTNGIITETYDNYNANASRGMVAVIFNRAIKASGKNMDEINAIQFGALKDVANEAWYSGGVYSLYRYGIMTGDGNGNMNPEASIKRSEISAVLTRVVDKSHRQTVTSAASDTSKASATDTTQSTETKTTSDSALVLYTGSHNLATIEGVKAVAAEFDTSAPGLASGAFNLDLIGDVTLEKDNLSFNVYKDTGYDTLTKVREWLNAAASGKNGKSIAEASEVKDELNSLAFVYIDGTRYTLSSLWYSDYTDYSAYALYFDKEVDPSKVSNVRFLIGSATSATLSKYGLTTLSELLAGTAEYSETPTYTASDISDITIAYAQAYNNVKNNAAEIIFEGENSRCAILYGRGLNGTASTEYSLILVYKDGTVQVVKNKMLENLRLSSDHSILYFYEVGADGRRVQNALNFTEPKEENILQ